MGRASMAWTFHLIFLSCLSHGWIGYVAIQDRESANNLRKSILTGCEIVCILNLGRLCLETASSKLWVNLQRVCVRTLIWCCHTESGIWQANSPNKTI